MHYSYITEQDMKASVIPARMVNGGRDTGPVATGPWASISVVPDPITLSQNLGTAVPPPPPYAQQQPATFNRPGNNRVAMPYHKVFSDAHNLQCMQVTTK